MRERLVFVRTERSAEIIKLNGETKFFEFFSNISNTTELIYPSAHVIDGRQYEGNIMEEDHKIIKASVYDSRQELIKSLKCNCKRHLGNGATKSFNKVMRQSELPIQDVSE